MQDCLGENYSEEIRLRMLTVDKFQKSMMGQLKEFTYRWWTDRDPDNQNFFYHIDDKFYEDVLRHEAEDLLTIIFDSFRGSVTEQLEAWAIQTATKRVVQGNPADEAIERFRMFRRTLIHFFEHFAEVEGLKSMECLRITEQFNHTCELAMQNWMTQYMYHKHQYFNEQKKRFDMERLASIGQMAAGVAHEVRNPLTATRGFLQLLAESHPHHFLDIAMQELDRGIQTISTLLDVAKPNQPQVAKRPVSVYQVLLSVMDLFNEKLYAKTVLFECTDEDTLINGQEEMLKQAFFNLIKNAIEAMRATPEPILILRHKRVNNHLIVEIQDNGEGVPEEKLHLLGTPFFTLKDTGVGLGLTMVYRTMHEHYADITVHSNAGKGALFRFVFPLS